MQRLTLPYRFLEVLAGYKVPAYPLVKNAKTGKPRGYHHFGWDLFSYDNPVISDRGKVTASGVGRVLAVGMDNAVGNCVVVRYDAAQLQNGTVLPLVARYFHLAKWLCYAGQTVAQGTLLGIEGNTGTAGTHLHVEFDRDTQWPMYSVQVAGGNFVLNHGRAVDSTVDPATVFWKRSGDVIVPSRYGTGWNTIADTKLAAVPPATPASDALERLKQENNDINLLLQIEKTKSAGLEMKLLKIKELAG